MKYNSKIEVTIITYADGSVVVSSVGQDNMSKYQYICAFDNTERARVFIEKNIDEPVFLKEKKLLDLAKEFNCGIVWPGLVGIAYICDEENVEYIDADELIKMAYKNVAQPNKSYGSDIIIDGKISNTEDIDFNKKYFIIVNENENLTTNQTYNRNGKKKDWLIISDNKKSIQDKAMELGIKNDDKNFVKYPLFNLLVSFLPKRECCNCDGILYIGKNEYKTISKRKIRTILAERESVINDLFSKSEIFLDDKYFVAINKKDSAITVAEYGNKDYVIVSQRMDTMLKSFKQEGLNTKNLAFINTMSLREILAGCDDSNYDGISLFIDDNPDHIINVTLDDMYWIAKNGSCINEEFGETEYDRSQNEFMMKMSYTMMIDGCYIINSIISPDSNEMIDVIAVADSEDILLDGLEKTGYVFGEESPSDRKTYEIFSEFRDGQLIDCHGIVYFDENGFYILQKDLIISALEEWEMKTNQESIRVELDFDSEYYVAFGKYGLMTYTQSNGMTFVIISKSIEHLQCAIDELFEDYEIKRYKKDQTLIDIATNALQNGMGLVVCDHTGIVFVDPKQLKQSMPDDI